MMQDARYTSPSGKEAAFEWETGKRKTELKTGVYTFPGRDGAHVQHQGAGARSFPLACIFSGDDCMEKADAFEDMLIERGIGELQHPIYGTIKVVPTGDIEREDDPVNKLGESIVGITFTETITDEESDELNEIAADAINEELEEFTEAAALDFAEALDIEDMATQIEIISALDEQTQSMIDSLGPIAAMDKKGHVEFLATARELKDNIKNLYSKTAKIAGAAESYYVKALNVARLTLRLMKLPSTLLVSLSEKIKGYGTLTANLINQHKNDPFGITKMKAAYATASLAITGACAAIASGTAISVAEIAAMTGAAPAASRSSTAGAMRTAIAGTVRPENSGGITGTISREEAVETSRQIAAFLEMTNNFQDEKVENLNSQNTENQNIFIDAAPAAHIAFMEIVQLSIELILNAAFALPMQKTITLDRDRQVVELCAELYGTTDCLDDFIIQNNFNIDEIELLPMGKKVSYYVQSA